MSLVLFHGSGAGDFVLESTTSLPAFEDLKESVLELLKARGDTHAIELLSKYPFNLCAATNHFNDEFCVLHASVPVGLYEEARLRGTSAANRGAFLRIANTFTEIGAYVRFIAVDLSRRSAGGQQEKPSSAMPASPSLSLKVFLCHASGDKPAVRELYDRLVADGFSPWLDEKSLVAGQDWHHEIKKAVRASDVVVVCLSNGSITKEGYVQKEIKLALDVEEEKPEGTIYIIPARLEEVRVPDRLIRWQWVNLFDQNGYSELVRALRLRHAATTQKSTPAPEAQPRSPNKANENELTEAMYSAYYESKKLKYNPARFFQMLLEKGALATAKSLLAGDIDGISEGFTTLWKLKRLDLSVEAICLRPEFRGFFSDKERSTARKRLGQVGYQTEAETADRVPESNEVQTKLENVLRNALVGTKSSNARESIKIQNRDGTPEPLLVTGSYQSAQDSSMRVIYGILKIINKTQQPVSIAPLRLMVDGKEWPVHRVFFQRMVPVPTKDAEATVLGNHVDEYRLLFMFPSGNCPERKSGTVVFRIDDEERPISVQFG